MCTSQEPPFGSQIWRIYTQLCFFREAIAQQGHLLQSNPSNVPKTRVHELSNEYLNDVNGRLLPGSISVSVMTFERINFNFILEPPIRIVTNN